MLRWTQLPQFSVQAQKGSVRLSALLAPRAAVLATAGAQQRLQSHLHKRLEVIASLPSAVLRRGRDTDR